MKSDQIKSLLETANNTISKWELDNIVYWDRWLNPKTLIEFFQRIEYLKNNLLMLTNVEKKELTILEELLEEIEINDAKRLLEYSDEKSKSRFIEELARTCAIETLTLGKLKVESMNTACKLSPNDFLLCAKRTQDLINSIHGLVIKSETLSEDVAGA
jgi:hypothetical protein